VWKKKYFVYAINEHPTLQNEVLCSELEYMQRRVKSNKTAFFLSQIY